MPRTARPPQRTSLYARHPLLNLCNHYDSPVPTTPVLWHCCIATHAIPPKKFTQEGVGRAPAHQNRTELFIEKHSPWNCVNLGHMPALLAVIRRLRTWEKALCRKGFSSQILYVIFFVSFFSILEQFWAVRPGVFS